MQKIWKTRRYKQSRWKPLTRRLKGGAFDKIPNDLLGDTFENFKSRWEVIFVSGHGNIDDNMFIVPENTYIVNLATAGRNCKRVNWDIEKFLYNYENPQTTQEPILKKIFGELKRGSLLTSQKNTTEHMYSRKSQTGNVDELYTNITQVQLSDQDIADKFYEVDSFLNILLDPRISGELKTQAYGKIQEYLRKYLGLQNTCILTYVDELNKATTNDKKKHYKEKLDILFDAAPSINELIPMGEKTLSIYQPGDLLFNTNIAANNPSWPIALRGAYVLPIPYTIKKTLFDANKPLLFDGIVKDAGTIKSVHYNYRKITQADRTNPPNKQISNSTGKIIQDYQAIFRTPENLLSDKMFPPGSSRRENFTLGNIVNIVNTRDTSKLRLFFVKACRDAPTETFAKKARRLSIASRVRTQAQTENLLRNRLNIDIIRTYYTAAKAKFDDKVKYKLSKNEDKQKYKWRNQKANGSSESEDKVRAALDYIATNVLQTKLFSYQKFIDNLTFLSRFLPLRDYFGLELMSILEIPDTVTAATTTAATTTAATTIAATTTATTRKKNNNNNNATGAGAGPEKKTTE